jgi:hypothetical protein
MAKKKLCKICYVREPHIACETWCRECAEDWLNQPARYHCFRAPEWAAKRCHDAMKKEVRRGKKK